MEDEDRIIKALGWIVKEMRDLSSRVDILLVEVNTLRLENRNVLDRESRPEEQTSTACQHINIED